MTTNNADDLRSLASPLDLSLKLGNISKTPIMTADDGSRDSHSFVQSKSISSQELLALKLLHDRLNKTMELLLPPEVTSSNYDYKPPQFLSPNSPKPQPEFDYRKAMKTLLSLVDEDNCPANDDDIKTVPSIPQNKSQSDAWAYWHDYILSLYLMNSSFPTSVLPHPPPVPPPALFPAPFSYVPTSQNSLLFHNMLTSIVDRSPVKNQKDSPLKMFNHEVGYKTKKLNSYQFLKDSNSLYNSFAANRNLGIGKSKLLDSPESFGVSLRGNQKYSIYYQQRPNNLFNNTFNATTSSSSSPSKLNSSLTSKYSVSTGNRFYHEEPNKRAPLTIDTNHRRSGLYNSEGKVTKGSDRNMSTPLTSKNNPDKSYKFSDDYGTSGVTFDSLPQISNRCRETVFNCSCGQEFENLYSFTIHMKSTHHTPNSSKIERSIPKLVRGQDMWINSETEQTKEILRCMRCQQSFRTLPELTMHMVETNHYSEIVYSDTGKCVFLNSDSDKVRPGYTTASSPASSPGDILRMLKRPVSSSTGSEVGPDEDSFKKRKTDSIFEEVTSDSEKPTEVEVSSGTSCRKEVALEIHEADSEATNENTGSCNSVIRQIENFVEKSLPKPNSNEYNVPGLIPGSGVMNQKSGKSTNKLSTTKGTSVDRVWKVESKTTTDLQSKHKDKVEQSLKYKTYPVTSTEGVESNPLSSLQSLVETIQKNTSQTKDQATVNHKVVQSGSYSYPSKSPVVCDSLSQLQALVAKQNGHKPPSYPSEERGNIHESSATFISWCHRLGELLGLPQALSQAMLTQDAIKDLTNSVLAINNETKSSSHVTDDSNNNDNCPLPLSGSTSDSENKSFPDPESDPIEQLKNLLNSTPDSTNQNSRFHSKFHGRNSTQESVSKKVKCQFCNKPFANKGQVRLHISKGKCPSLMRSSHSNCNQIESPAALGKVKDTVGTEMLEREDQDPKFRDKSVNLIREYFQFAKQMLANDGKKSSTPGSLDNVTE